MLFPGRPHSILLGANALLRTNLAHAGGDAAHAQISWAETVQHLPFEILQVRDRTFSNVWPR